MINNIKSENTEKSRIQNAFTGNPVRLYRKLLFLLCSYLEKSSHKGSADVPVRMNLANLFFLNTSILLFLVISIMLLTSGYALAQEPLNPDQLELQCQKILGPNRGAIIVLDLEKRKPIVVVNNRIAYTMAVRPGSIFKLVTAACLLENHRVNLSETIVCSNRFRFMGKDYMCSEVSGHGEVNLVKSLSHSCSVYFFHLAQRLKPAELERTSKSLGFGKAIPYSEIEIKPAAGTCKAPSDPRDFVEFAVGDNQGIMITPIQAANLLCIIATGQSLEGCPPAPNFKKKTFDILRKGMGNAVLSGTCKEISKAGISAGGKTGTSTNDRIPGKTHAWFMGFMPLKKPRYGVVVFLEDGKGYPDACPRGLKVMKILKQSTPP